MFKPWKVPIWREVRAMTVEADRIDDGIRPPMKDTPKQAT